jgi:small Trp-rich protein
MYLLFVGVALMLLKYLEIGMVATWSWWIILAPFGLAVAWWTWSDASGHTKRKAMEKEAQKKQDRIDKNRANIGLAPGVRKKR